jgi:hypothetical protein
MNPQKPGVLTPALIAGVVAGVLSALPFAFCLCCLWIIGGGIFASYLLAKNSPLALRSGDGAIVGIFTGIIAAVTDSLVSLPMQAVNREVLRKFMERFAEFFEEMPEGWDNIMDRGTAPETLPTFLLGLLLSAFIFAALGLLGGVIGVSLFGKKKTPSAPGVISDTSQGPGQS